MKINDKGQIDVDEDDVKIRECFWKSRLAELKAINKALERIEEK